MSNTNPKPERWREWEQKHLQASDADRTRMVNVLNRDVAATVEHDRKALGFPRVLYVGAALQAFLKSSIAEKRAAIEAYRTVHKAKTGA
ncbi:hypothetical protein LGM58_20095 [Burkholderia contaminans]|uniref:hypothetical protein n=1 Tax=Burkholderia contaminans TaxID=488447 RepID=UPI001CF1045F|nr:hypothetical protein [Burkholderia contaminans]MCA7885487.1 hypothetical protein [Burkholderia contaminans]